MYGVEVNQDGNNPEWSCEEICEMYLPSVYDNDDTRQQSFLESFIN